MNKVDICNLALARVGNAPIHSLADDSAEARRCAMLFEPVLRRVLRSGHWSCARALARLAELAEPPPFGFSRQYQLPSDCLRLIRLNGGADTCRRVGDRLHTDAAYAHIEYVRNAIPGELDDLCAEAVACLLARELAVAVNADPQLSEALLKEYLMTASCAARGVDALESLPPPPRGAASGWPPSTRGSTPPSRNRHGPAHPHKRLQRRRVQPPPARQDRP